MKSKLKFLALLLAIAAMSGACAKTKAPGLRFRYWGDLSEIKILEDDLKEFEAANPGLNIYSERKPPDNNYGDLLTTEFATGNAPDVIFIGDLNCDKLIETGCFIPLDSFLATDPSLKKSDYYARMIERFSYQGSLYVLPRDIAPIACIYYNKKLFDQAGLKYPKDNWTWKEFKADAVKLMQRDELGKAIHWGYADEGPTPEAYIFSSGGTMVDDPKAPKRITMDSPKALRGLQLRLDLIRALKVMPGNADSQAIVGSAEGMFLSGKLGMFYSGIWKTPSFREIKDFDWDIAPFPAGPDGNRQVPIAGSGYAISKLCKDPAAAWKLVRFLAGEPGQRKLASTGLAQPALKKLANSPAFLDGKKPLNKKMLLKAAELGYTSPAIGIWNEYMQGIWRAKTDIIWVDAYQGDMATEIRKAVEEGNSKFFSSGTAQ